LFDVLEKSSIEDNPVLMIAKIKKEF